jgi:site-specific recombinase XerD
MASHVPAIPEPTLTPDLASTVEQAEQYFAQAKADHTLRSYASGWRDFVAWCAKHHLGPAPATPQTVVLYLTQRAREVTVSTLTSRLAAIRFFHHRLGHDTPTTDRVVRDVLSGIRRTKGTRPAQVQGMTRDVLERLLDATGHRLIDRRNRALLVVAYDVLGRRSELVALDVEDLFRAPDGSATVLIRRSKTDPSGTGVHLYLAPDTVAVVDDWLAAAGITTGALFQSITKGGRVRARLSADYVARVFKQMALAAELPVEVVGKIAGHSARVGAAQDMATHGFDLAAIMQAGRWKTPHMVGRYTEHISARRGAAARLARSQARHEPVEESSDGSRP